MEAESRIKSARSMLTILESCEGLLGLAFLIHHESNDELCPEENELSKAVWEAESLVTAALKMLRDKI